jgi:hypothetical protein
VGPTEPAGGGEQLDGIEPHHGAARFLGVEGPGEARENHAIAVVEVLPLAPLLQAGGSVVLKEQSVLGVLSSLEQERRPQAGSDGKGSHSLVAIQIPPVGGGAHGLQPLHRENAGEHSGRIGWAGGVLKPRAQRVLEGGRQGGGLGGSDEGFRSVAGGAASPAEPGITGPLPGFCRGWRRSAKARNRARRHETFASNCKNSPYRDLANLVNPCAAPRPMQQGIYGMIIE